MTDEERAALTPGPLRSSAWHAADVLRWLTRTSPATSPLLPLSLRRSLLRLGGCQVGEHVTGLKQCSFGTARVSIGDGCFVNAGCSVEGSGQVDIGRDVFFGPQVMILTSIHDVAEDGTVSRMPRASQVSVGHRCWLGARSVIMPGVTVGAGAIVGAGAVVTRDCDPGGRYAGVPARRIR